MDQSSFCLGSWESIISWCSMHGLMLHGLASAVICRPWCSLLIGCWFGGYISLCHRTCSSREQTTIYICEKTHFANENVHSCQSSLILCRSTIFLWEYLCHILVGFTLTNLYWFTHPSPKALALRCADYNQEQNNTSSWNLFSRTTYMW